MPKPTTEYSEEEILMVRGALLPTWQSVVAVSMHAGVPHRRTLTILREEAGRLGIERRDARLDGHNPVWMVRLTPSDMGGLA